VKLTDLFIDQLKAEANRTRRVLEQMPEGRDDWKPHDKSMPFGRLAMLVARMPSAAYSNWRAPPGSRTKNEAESIFLSRLGKTWFIELVHITVIDVD
jgi:hypothetical protein